MEQASENYATRSADASCLDQLFEAYERDGTFPLLFKYNAAFRGGKIYVESPETVTFITGKAATIESYGFEKVCPSTQRMIKDYNDMRAGVVSMGGTPGPKLFTSLPPEYSRNYIVMPTQVADDKADLLGHLAAIFQGTVWCTKKIKEAKGDGMVYLEALRKKHKDADINDKTATVAEYDQKGRKGSSGSDARPATSTQL